MYRNINLSLVFIRVQNWLITKKQENTLQMIEKKELGKIFGHKTDSETERSMTMCFMVYADHVILLQ